MTSNKSHTILKRHKVRRTMPFSIIGKTVVGIDEVGRGPLAGPVTVCVVSCGLKIYPKLKNDRDLPPKGKDSKKLKQKEREQYAEILKILLKKGKIFYSINHISNKTIDSKGLSFAIKKAISLGIKKLRLKPVECQILLDGGLKAPKDFKKQKTIIKGDEKEKIIAWASILAKVSRDALMRRLSKRFPKYEFNSNKGYGTLKHRKMLKKYGLSVVHRKTFCRNLSSGRL